MLYRRLGNSGLKVSEIGLGSWLTFGHAVAKDVTTSCLRSALELGINFIDTSDVYAMGASEAAIGEALVHVPRKDYVLATKVFFPTGPGINDKGLSRKHMSESLTASLRRLRTDYIDLYQCHRFDPETPIIEVVRTMDDFVRQGKIFYWGTSMWSAEAIAEAVATAKTMNAVAPISNQPNYNILERDIETSVIPTCAELSVSQIVYSPLAQGLLTGKYQQNQLPKGSRALDNRSNQFIKNRMTEENFTRIEELKKLAERLGVPLVRLALAFCLQQSNVSSAIVGVTRPEQISENVSASGVHLSEETLREIRRIVHG